MGFRSKIYVRAGQTNGVADYNAEMDVTGDIIIGRECWIYPMSHVFNGGSSLFRMRDLLIDKDGGVDATAWGFVGGQGPGKGASAASDNVNGGAGHGGKGGNSATGYVGGPK